MKLPIQTLIALSAVIVSTNLWAEGHSQQTHLQNAAMTASGQGSVRAATCRDCFNAGFQKAMNTRIAMPGTQPSTSSSVTTPQGFRPGANVAQVNVAQQRQQAQAVGYIPQNFARPKQPTQVARVQQPRVQTPQVQQQRVQAQPAQPRPVARITRTAPQGSAQGGKIRHHDHTHHTAVERADCELTDALNRSAKPMTTAMNNHGQHQAAPVRHGNHHHSNAVERADCELTDALNRSAGTVKTVLRTAQGQAHKPQMSPAPIRHGNHHHKDAVERADCELTDALNRRASPVVTKVH